MRRLGKRLSNAFRNRGNELWEGGVSRASVGKVKVKSKKSSNSLLFPDKKKSCFIFQFPSSCSTDVNISILPVPVLNDLKATAFPAACTVRSDATLAHCLVRSASACSGSSPCPRRHAGALVSACGHDFLVDGGLFALPAHHSSACVGARAVTGARVALHSVDTLDWQVVVARRMIFLR